MSGKSAKVANHPVTLRLPPDLLEEVRAFVRETGVPFNTAMIKFLQRGLPSKEEQKAKIDRAFTGAS